MHSQVAGEGNKDIECFPLAGEGIEDVGVFSKAEEKKENTELAEELTEGIQVIKSNDWSEGFSDKTKIIRAEAGITCAKLAKFCARHGLIGAEFFAGIPGTVGGALAMNAGAWGGETWQYVVKVQIINKRGERFYRQPSDYCIGYRRVVRKDLKVGDHLPEEWFVAGFFKFELGDAAVATQRIKALLRERKLKQPIGVFSCGSVFKNPTGDYAGRLIEASNLKGYKLGGAEISTKHGNFILNVGNATASDIYSLIQHVKRVIWEDHKVSLQTEVQYLGQFAEC